MDDVFMSDSRKRLWYARNSIIETLTTMGVSPGFIDRDYTIARGCAIITKWMAALAMPTLTSVMGPAFSKAFDEFKLTAPDMTIDVMAPCGIVVSGDAISIVGGAYKFKFKSATSDLSDCYIIPVSRSDLQGASEWTEFVALFPTALIREFMILMDSAKSAERQLSSTKLRLDVYNGPPIKIQPAKLDDIMVEPQVKAQFVDDVIAFLSRKSWYETRNIPWNRKYLLNGPPGTGKTSLIRWLISSLGMPAFGFDFSDKRASGGDFVSALNLAASMAPSFFVLDDMDRVMDTDNASGVNQHVIQTALSGVGSLDGVIVVATSNDPKNLLAGAMGRRFDVMVTLNLPDDVMRRAYLNKMFSKDSVSATTIDRVSSETQGWSYSDLLAVVTSAANNSMSRRSNKIEDQDVLVGHTMTRGKKTASPAFKNADDEQEED